MSFVPVADLSSAWFRMSDLLCLLTDPGLNQEEGGKTEEAICNGCDGGI